MKKEYTFPMVEIVKIENNDILTESTGWGEKPGDVGSM